MAFAMVGFSFYGLHAQTVSNGDSQKILKTQNEQSPVRHKMPSPDYEAIGFTYLNGVASFTMPQYITYIKVTIENETGDILSSYVYAANPFWTVSLAPGEYSIKCEADEDSEFEGFIYID